MEPSVIVIALAVGALSIQLQELLDIAAGMRSGSAQARVAGLLATVANRLELPASINVSQQEVSELLGLGRMTVNTALREYEQLGSIRRRYGRIEVLERENLEHAALG